MFNLFSKVRDALKNGTGIAKRKWLRFIGLTAIELIMVTLLALPFLETISAHPALPDDLERNLQLIGPAEFGYPPDTPLVNNGPEAAIPALQGSTTLTVSIETSDEAVVDNNGSTASTFIPEVYVIEAAVTNQGSEAATNVVITLDYNDSAPWVLVPGEESIRTVDSLGAGETTYAYWFAQQDPDDANAGDIHQYTISAVADNAALVSTSQNKFEPNLNTVRTVEYADTGNQGLTQADFAVNVGVAFTMTQVFATGSNPEQLLLNPVGNSDFDAAAYRLLSVDGRALDAADTELATFTDAVSVTVPIATTKFEVNYSFLALLPRDTSVCPYVGVINNNGGSRKYDENYCSDTLDTKFNIDGSIALEMTKKVDLVEVEQGQQLQYTINYTNTDPTQPINFGWFWDEVPTGVSILTPTINPPSHLTETTNTRVAWNIGTIPPNSSDELSFSVLVDGGGADLANGTELVNEAYFGINPGTTIPARSALSSTVTSTVRAPVIAVTKTDGVVTANPGDQLSYVIYITNTGSIAASGLVVTDQFPDDVLIGTPSIPPDSQIGQALVWNLGSQATGVTISITIPIQIDPNLSVDGTVLTNTVDVSYQNSVGHTFATETAEDTTTVDVPTTTLSLSKTAEDLNGAPLVLGDIIRYTLQVTNTGSFTAFDVTVTDDLPDEVTCQSVTGGPGVCSDPLIWNVGNMAPNQSETLLIDVKIKQSAGDADIVNTASVTGTNVPAPPTPPEVCPDGSPPNGANCDETPDPNSETTLDLSKTAEDGGGTPDVLEVGDTITYTLMVTNTGNYTAFDVIVTDDLSEHVTCQSVIPSPPVCPIPPSNTITWNVGNLAPNGEPGDTATLMIIVEIDPSGEGLSIINSAVATGTNVFDPPPVPEVCPDGSEPIGGACPIPDGVPGPDPNPDGIYLPIVIKN